MQVSEQLLALALLCTGIVEAVQEKRKGRDWEASSESALHASASDGATPTQPSTVNAAAEQRRPGVGKAGRKRLPVSTPEEALARAKNRERAKKAYERKRLLGTSSYLNLRPEQRLRWVPPEVAELPSHRIQMMRLKMLGLKKNEVMSSYSIHQPWIVLQRVSRLREINPDISLEEAVTTERAKWDEEMRAINEADQFAGRGQDEIQTAVQRARYVHAVNQHFHRVSGRIRPVGQSRENLVRTKYGPDGQKVDTHIARLLALHKQNQEATTSSATVSTTAEEHPSDQDITHRGKRRKLLPFDLNLPASEETSTSELQRSSSHSSGADHAQQ